jgi:toxin ParE1/3/4
VKVRWTPEAKQDRLAVLDHIAEHDVAAALRIDALIGGAAARLADFPLIGHEGEVPGTRELTPHRSYRLIYEVRDDTVWILVLVHTARQWPPLASR